VCLKVIGLPGIDGPRNCGVTGFRFPVIYVTAPRENPSGGPRACNCVSEVNAIVQNQPAISPLSLRSYSPNPFRRP